jgi:hypothetical protein
LHKAKAGKETRTPVDGSLNEQQIKTPARQDGKRGTEVHASPARRNAAHLLRLPGLGENLLEHPEPPQRLHRIGDQCIAADLLAREGMLINEQHRAALRCKGHGTS